jgi:polysaccharide export outer membrane protein
VAFILIVDGCQAQLSSHTPAPTSETAAQNASTHPEVILREGDVVKISVPGAPSLDSVQTIRRDGRITLPLVGEVIAAGRTPLILQAELVQLYAPQIVSKEVVVTLVSSSFYTFVTGAVLRPGKITSNQPLTLLEAIMEAGGFDYTKANVKGVVVIRKDAEGRTHNQTVNLKRVLDGTDSQPFFLQPSDIVFVPERFTLF